MVTLKPDQIIRGFVASANYFCPTYNCSICMASHFPCDVVFRLLSLRANTSKVECQNNSFYKKCEMWIVLWLVFFTMVVETDTFGIVSQYYCGFSSSGVTARCRCPTICESREAALWNAKSSSRTEANFPCWYSIIWAAGSFKARGGPLSCSIATTVSKLSSVRKSLSGLGAAALHKIWVPLSYIWREYISGCQLLDSYIQSQTIRMWTNLIN